MSANMKTFPFSGRTRKCLDCGTIHKGKWFHMQFRNLSEVRTRMEWGSISEWRREHGTVGSPTKWSRVAPALIGWVILLAPSVLRGF